MKKLLGIVVLNLLWCSTANSLTLKKVWDVLDEKESLDNSYICTSRSKALKNDWTEIWDKLGFVSFGTPIERIQLFSGYNSREGYYFIPNAIVERIDLQDDEHYDYFYTWAQFYENITYKLNGKKGPVILLHFLSKIKKKNNYFYSREHIRISIDEYKTLELFNDDAEQYLGKSVGSYIKALKSNRNIIVNLYAKSLNEGKSDKKFFLGCKKENPMKKE